MEYRITPLHELIRDMGEDGAKAVLSTFSCPRNPDIEAFLRARRRTAVRLLPAKICDVETHGNASRHNRRTSCISS